MAVGPDAKLLNHDDPTEVFFSIDLDRQAKMKKRKVQNEKPPSRINLKKIDEYKNDMVEDMFKKKYNRENNIQNIEKLGFNKEYYCPDGNCFFHALEFLTGMSHQALRKGIVTRMKIQSNVYNQLFTDQLKMKYYIEDATLEQRFQRMAKYRTWAGQGSLRRYLHHTSLGKIFWRLMKLIMKSTGMLSLEQLIQGY